MYHKVNHEKEFCNPSPFHKATEYIKRNKIFDDKTLQTLENSAYEQKSHLFQVVKMIK